MVSLKKLSIIAMVAVMGLMLVACGQQAQTPPEEETPATEAVEEEAAPVAGLANPASVYCQGLGYTEETRTNDAGEYGMCIFPDGSECDTWDFLAGRCGQSFSYCVQQGYTLEEMPDSNIGNCVFPDGSSCMELDFFQGTCGPSGG